MITLVGDSHHLFLGEYIARERLPVKYKVCPGGWLLAPFATLTEGGEIEWTKADVKERYGDALKNEGPIGISLGSVLSVFARDSMWRQYAPWRVSERAGLTPLSDGMLRKLVVDQSAAGLAFIGLLASARFKAFVVEPPPLKRSHPGIQAGTAPVVLREFDAQWRQIMRDEYRKRGLPWVEAPVEAFGDDGFLKDEYNFRGEEDPHHANTPYAALLVPQLLKMAA